MLGSFIQGNISRKPELKKRLRSGAERKKAVNWEGGFGVRVREFRAGHIPWLQTRRLRRVHSVLSPVATICQ